MIFNEGEVWFVSFPYEEDPTKFSNRPVIVLDAYKRMVLSVKITKHKVRSTDPYDTPILYWSTAGLRMASTARVSKVQLLDENNFIFKIGDLHPDDLTAIEEQFKKYINDNNV